MITINTLYYVLLWIAMMLIGGVFYAQPLRTMKFKKKKLQVLELVGGFIIIAAMLGMLHGVLAFFNLILPL